MKPYNSNKPTTTSNVAPLAGAWIETQGDGASFTADIESLPSRERGLKLSPVYKPISIILSLPSRERGLKHLPLDGNNKIDTSLPSRERGLKQTK